MECGTIITGPNDARRIVWGVFLFSLVMLKARLEAASRAKPSWGSRRPCEAVNDGLDGPRLGLHFFKALGCRLVRRLGWLVELYSYFFFFTLFTTCTWISTENIKKSMARNFSQGYRSCDHCDYVGGMFFFFFKTHCLLLMFL